jgi:hypothetical protein
MSLQLDDGQLKCLPHPGEQYSCEKLGLTLEQASDRGRLFRETFFVCRHCGKDGEIIETQRYSDPATVTVRNAMKWGWSSAVIVVPFLIWIGWWQAAAVVGATLLSSPGAYWWENRKRAKAMVARGFPRSGAPGSIPIAPPTVGCDPEVIVGQPLPSEPPERRATGPCCDQREWIEAFRVSDDDHIPCPACGRGRMTTSAHSIH